MGKHRSRNCLLSFELLLITRIEKWKEVGLGLGVDGIQICLKVGAWEN